MRPVDEIVMILVEEVEVEGRVVSTFRRDWVTRLWGVMTNPLVSLNLGVPPTVKRRISTLVFSFPSPLPASVHALATSDLTSASPLINLALPVLTNFWIVESVSNTVGLRRRKVTVAPLSIGVQRPGERRRGVNGTYRVGAERRSSRCFLNRL